MKIRINEKITITIHPLGMILIGLIVYKLLY